MADNKKPSIFEKILEAGSTMLDAQIHKARASIEDEDRQKKDKDDTSEFSFGKAVTRDRTLFLGQQGYQEKAGALSYEYMRQMAIRSSIISAIVRTRQNRVAAYSEFVPEGKKPGFRIKLRHEQAMLDEIREELFGDLEGGEEEGTQSGQPDPKAKPAAEEKPAPNAFNKAVKPGSQDEGDGDEAETTTNVDALENEDNLQGEESPEDVEEPLSEEDMIRQAKAELDKRTKKKKKDIVEFLLHCGDTKDRPFDSQKWTFDSYLRAIIWDSLVYDQIATELVPKEAEIVGGKLNIHHFQPVDGSTVRYASPELSKYKNADMHQDILYPDDELKALEERDALELDDERLENFEYKYVQLIRGKIARAFTADELKVGMRNATSDIYVNGYSISELEMLVALVTSHLQTEFYNRSYFQQGFSAKGILHIKANLNRGKLEELRRNWNHMVKGNRNSFQTPIMAGMDAVEWIPLTQSHSEMEFTMWLNYLIRMICAIYQIDPSEIGYGMRDEGKSGMSGDNTKEKLENSKDKGFIPLMKFVQDYINKNIIEIIDPNYMLEWVGLEDESDMARISRQKEAIQWKMTLNEVRAEDGLPPIKGADHLILNPVYFQWYSTMSEEGQRFQQKQADQAMQQAQSQQPVGVGGENSEGDQKNWEADEASAENDHQRSIESKTLDHGNKLEQIKASKVVKKSIKSSDKTDALLKVEYFRVPK